MTSPTPASSEYYTQGTASPMLLPEFSEEEKLQEGSIDHTYCAGVDIIYDVNATGSLESSVLKGRFRNEYSSHVHTNHR